MRCNKKKMTQKFIDVILSTPTLRDQAQRMKYIRSDQKVQT